MNKVSFVTANPENRHSTAQMCKMVAERSERSRHRIYCGLITWFFVALHCLQWVSASDIQTMFNGSQYIAYPIPSHEGGSTSDRILLSFKTTEPYGVLFYSGGTQGDFVALEIIRGKLRWVFSICESMIILLMGDRSFFKDPPLIFLFQVCKARFTCCNAV